MTPNLIERNILFKLNNLKHVLSYVLEKIRIFVTEVNYLELLYLIDLSLLILVIELKSPNLIETSMILTDMIKRNDYIYLNKIEKQSLNMRVMVRYMLGCDIFV